MIDDIYKPRLAIIIADKQEDIDLIVRARNLAEPEDYQDYCTRILKEHGEVKDRLSAIGVMSRHFMSPKPKVTLTLQSPLLGATPAQTLSTVRSELIPIKIMYVADEFWVWGRGTAVNMRDKRHFVAPALSRDKLEEMAVSTQLLVEARRKAGPTKVEQG